MQINTESMVYNFGDEELSRAGVKGKEEVRQARVTCVADSGATMLTLPQEVVARLGLPGLRRVKVRYADGRVEEKEVVGGVRVEIQGRSIVTDALIEKAGAEALLGYVVMELLDLVVDPGQGIIKPREESPEMPLMEQL